jgi:hypothetical protein
LFEKINFDRGMDTLQSVFSFNGKNSRLEISQPLREIQEAITIEFWAKAGNQLVKNPSILEGYNAQNKRSLNVYFPWQHLLDTRIVWDAGNQKGYDRIHQSIRPEEYKKKWTHWAFVKDATTGEMSIYCNGNIWHQEQAKYKSLAGIEKLVIGGSVDDLHCWKGLLCEFRIWQTARSDVEIKKYMKKRLSGQEADLLLYYPLNNQIEDKTGHGYTGIIQGELVWQPAKVTIQPAAKKTKKLIIQSQANKLVLDVAGGQCNAANPVLAYVNNCGLNQKWTFTSDGMIKSLLGDYALDLQDIADFEWAKSVVINPVNGAETQQWEMSPSGVIKNKSNGFALGVVKYEIYDLVLAYPIYEENPKLTEKWQLINWR